MIFSKISIPKMLKVDQKIREMVSLYSMFVAKDEKTKYVPNPFS